MGSSRGFVLFGTLFVDLLDLKFLFKVFVNKLLSKSVSTNILNKRQSYGKLRGIFCVTKTWGVGLNDIYVCVLVALLYFLL